MRRLTVFALVSVLLAASCSGDEADSATTATSTPAATAAVTSTEAPDTTLVSTTTTEALATTSSTSTTAGTTTTSTLVTSVCPALVALPDGTLTFIGGSGDFDGDGTTDELVTYQSAPDAWRMRVVFADGGGADAAIGEAEDFAPPRPIGGFDIDGDGAQEVFVTVGAGASTILVGVFDVSACVATRVAAGGGPAVFPVGASVGAGSGLACPGNGLVRRTFAQMADETTFDGGYEEYTLDGAHLTSQGIVENTMTSEEAAALAGFDCGGLPLP